MNLVVGRVYGPSENKSMTVESPLGPVSITYNYWEKESVENITQEVVPHLEDEEYGFTGFLQKQLAIAQTLKNEGFEELDNVELDGAIVWERDAE